MRKTPSADLKKTRVAAAGRHGRLAQSEPRDPLSAVESSGVRLDPDTRQVSLNGREVELTTIEFDILEVLMRAAGRVVSRDEMAQRFYTRPATPYDRSIDVHISRIRAVIEDNPKKPRRIITVRAAGYVFAKAQD